MIKKESIPITVQLLIIIGYNKFPSVYVYKIINNDLNFWFKKNTITACFQNFYYLIVMSFRKNISFLWYKYELYFSVSSHKYSSMLYASINYKCLCKIKFLQIWLKLKYIDISYSHDTFKFCISIHISVSTKIYI